MRPFEPSGGYGGVSKLTLRGVIRTYSHEVGIVEATTVLGIGDDTIILTTPSSEIILLEVTRKLVKPVSEVDTGE